MKKAVWTCVGVLALAIGSMACGGSEGGDDSGDDDGTGGTCSGVELCERSINECAVNITMEQCLSFYDPSTSTCADVAAYESCNCDCIDAPSCGEYFSCGETCFADHC